MEKRKLLTMTRKQLAILAKQAGIHGHSRWAKEQLAAELARWTSGMQGAAHGGSDLPADYGSTRLTLMEVDPYWLFAYWEVTSRDCAAALSMSGSEGESVPWILRLFDVTSGATPGQSGLKHFDIPIQLEAGNWYVNFWAAGRSYYAEIGVLGRSGRFSPISRSNVAHLPAASPASRPQECPAVSVSLPETIEKTGTTASDTQDNGLQSSKESNSPVLSDDHSPHVSSEVPEAGTAEHRCPRGFATLSLSWTPESPSISGGSSSFGLGVPRQQVAGRKKSFR